MNIRDYRNTLDKISCTESFKKSMEEMLSAPPQEDSTLIEDGFERSSGRGFGRYAAIAAAVLLIAATGVLFHSMKNIQPDNIYPGTEYSEPTVSATKPAEPIKDPKDPDFTMPGNDMAERLDENWTTAVYIPKGPSIEDRAVTFNMTDVKALKDAISECSFVWSEESRFTDPRREEFMVGSLEIYTEGYIQEVFSSDSRLKRVAEGDWDKVVSILREQLHADKSVEEDVLALEIAQNIEANEKNRRAMEEAARSNPARGEVPGTELTISLKEEGCQALYLPIGDTQDYHPVSFAMNKAAELKEAINGCSFVWDDEQTTPPDSEAYYVSGLYIFPEGYIQDRLSSSAKLMKVAFGDWDKVMEILSQELHSDSIVEAELAIVKPEKEFTSMSADITADLKFDSSELYNISGSGKMYFIDKTRSEVRYDKEHLDSVLNDSTPDVEVYDGRHDKEYIYIEDSDAGYTGELTTAEYPEFGGVEYFYTEHTKKNRIDPLSSNWAVSQNENGFTASTNGSLYAPALEYRNIRSMVCQHLENLRDEDITNVKTRIEKIFGTTEFHASYTTSTGVNISMTLVIDAYGTPVYWEEYGVKRLLLYQLRNTEYNSSFEMPVPVLNQFE